MRREDAIRQPEQQRRGADRERRDAVKLLVSTGLVAAVGFAGEAWADGDPAASPPQPGDLLVHSGGEHKGEPIAAAEVVTGAKVMAAWAKDAASGTVRDRSRLNKIMLLRIDPAGFDEATAKRAAEGGILAYSDFCTHAGCLIENFRTAEGVIFCHCHGSMFDPKAGAKVVGGPAKRSLAALPIKIDGDHLVVAGAFEGNLGIPKA